MKWFGGISFVVFFAAFLSACSSPSPLICHERIEFSEPEKIKFNDNERILLCGDEKTDSWKSIPFSQAEFHLRAFLDSRAYFNPKFQFTNDQLIVNPGEQKFSTKIVYVGEPPEFNKVTLRDVIDKPLNGALLDTIQNWTLARLKTLGYACPDVKISAIQDTGVITVNVTTGPSYVFDTPTLKDPLLMYPETMRRFDAFKVGQPYDYNLSKLSMSRAENDGIVVSSQITYACPQVKKDSDQDAEGISLDLRHHLIGGDQRLVTIGAGASTEEFPIAQATWKSVRLDKFGSNLSVSIYGSQRQQKFQTTYNDFFLRYVPRLSFSPTVTIEHDNEPSYEYTEFQAKAPLTYKADMRTYSFLSSLGPAINRVFSNDPGSSLALTYFSTLGELTYTTHDYEFNQNAPRSGTYIDVNAEAIPGWGQNPFATVLQVQGSHLLELTPVDPEQWVLGFRYGASTTFTKARPTMNSSLPAEYFHTLGGDQDLRGFGRQELNNGTVGALTSAFFGTEIRYAKSLPVFIEPFLFFDLGKLGSEPFGFDDVLYYSPGFGVRLNTPFGSIRSTLAHGYLSKNADANPALEHLQFFISFGKEF